MNSQIEKRIGNNLRKIRESIKMTQNEASAKLQLEGCDITRSALAKIEVGQRHIYPDEIILFKQIYKTTYDKIFE
jgi:transcriptional regulator with XRE-family HTH domain